MSMVQDVRIAKRTGFCYGVREAVDKAKESADAGRLTHTLGQVVHNEGVIAGLHARGVVSIADLDEAEAGSAVVIRAHGVTPDRPRVGRGARPGRDRRHLLVGDRRAAASSRGSSRTATRSSSSARPNHPEVVGLLGFAPDAIVVDDEDDWDRIPRRKRMALITQSTQPPWKFERLAARMVHLAHELKIVNTVCPVTIRRQEDTVETAREVDFMVVVGGRSSANTKELTRLCEIVGTPVIQVEHARDLVDPAVFGDARIVGVTGGTSTPIEDLELVAERILEMAGTADAKARARELAVEALDAAATPAGRTTSLPVIPRALRARPRDGDRRTPRAGRRRSTPPAAAAERRPVAAAPAAR